MPGQLSQLGGRSTSSLKPGAERAGRFVFKTQRDAIAIAADLPRSVPHTNLPVAPEFVDDDGCVGALMSILWSKNHQANESCKGLNLPDTVFYRYRCPAHWFFTAADGQTKRKHKAHVTSQQIYSGFTKGLTDPRAIAALHIAKLSVEGEWPPKTKVEHLTAEELWEFLFHRDHKDDGLLQRFVPPRDGLNHVFRVVWSPDIIMMERRQNRTSMHDRNAKTTAHHRALTLEDEAGASRSRPVKCLLLGRRLRLACETIVQHAANVSAWRMRLTRLVLHFKLDEADRLCFLWCSSLRTSPGIEPALEGWLLSAYGASAAAALKDKGDSRDAHGGSSSPEAATVEAAFLAAAGVLGPASPPSPLAMAGLHRCETAADSGDTGPPAPAGKRRPTAEEAVTCAARRPLDLADLPLDLWDTPSAGSPAAEAAATSPVSFESSAPSLTAPSRHRKASKDALEGMLAISQCGHSASQAMAARTATAATKVSPTSKARAARRDQRVASEAEAATVVQAVIRGGAARRAMAKARAEGGDASVDLADSMPAVPAKRQPSLVPPALPSVPVPKDEKPAYIFSQDSRRNLSAGPSGLSLAGSAALAKPLDLGQIFVAPQRNHTGANSSGPSIDGVYSDEGAQGGAAEEEEADESKRRSQRFESVSKVAEQSRDVCLACGAAAAECAATFEMLIRYHRRIDQVAPQHNLGRVPSYLGLVAAAAAEVTEAPRPRQWQVPAAWGASVAEVATASAAATAPLESRPGLPRQGAVERGDATPPRSPPSRRHPSPLRRDERALPLEQGQVPALIAAALPKLSSKRYELLRQEPAFQTREVTLCLLCYIHVADVGAPELHAFAHGYKPPPWGAPKRRSLLGGTAAAWANSRPGSSSRPGSASSMRGCSSSRPASAVYGRSRTITSRETLADRPLGASRVRPGSAPVFRQRPASGGSERTSSAVSLSHRSLHAEQPRGPNRVKLERPASVAVTSVMRSIAEQRAGKRQLARPASASARVPMQSSSSVKHQLAMAGLSSR